ncbi:hypothetical protein BDV18DRAFT_161797 [Aspergillus unguis]
MSTPATTMPASAQAIREKSSYLLKASQADENERLNIQHRLLIHMMEQKMVHPDTPKKLERVADVATGNGNWLFDFKKSRAKDSESNTDTKYTGFDITPDLFPKPDSPNVADMDFSVQDIFKPFPEDHVGTYDLVHVRNLVLAVKDEDLKTALQNISSLLKPGGYLQWEEYDFADQLAACPPSIMASTWEVVLNWIAGRGYSLSFSKNITAGISSPDSGLDLVEAKQFTTKGLPFTEDHRLTLLHAFYTGVPRLCWKAKGKSDEEAAKVEDDCFQEWESGVLLDYYLTRITARKPVD